MPHDLLNTLFSNVWSVFLVVLFFVGSIVVHELGHFLAARWCGVHVERFSIGFGRAIFSWRGKDGVEYRLSWIPLGGYVLLPQLADLSMIEGKADLEAAALPPITYRSRMVVLAAGALFNLLFAFALATIIWIAGQPESTANTTTQVGYVAKTVELPDGRSVPSPALTAGLRVGDVVRSIDGSPVHDWQDMLYLIGLGSGKAADGQREALFRIERDGQPLKITVHPLLVGQDRDRRVGIAPGYDLIVQQITPGSVAERAGFKPNDTITRLDATRILTFNTYVDKLESDATKPVTAHVLRNGADVALTIPPRQPGKNAAVIGLGLTIGVQLTHPSPFTQISDQITLTFRTLASLLNPRSDVGLSKVSGPVGIVRILHSAAEAGIRVAVIFAILVNVNLAIFNLLPLPILDGGQMLFATIGKVRGRALPPNFVIAAQSAFGVLLLAMVLYVSAFDIRRWIRDVQADHADAQQAENAAAK